MVTTTIDLTTRRNVGRSGKTPNVIVIHTMEAPEGPNTAENIAKYFKTVNASSHWCVDNNSRVRVVKDEDTAWTAPPINSRSLNIELAGYAGQTAKQWADAYSLDELDIAALCAAEWCSKYSIPVRKLTHAQLQAGEKGFVGHVDVSEVYKASDHWDPGPNFPWTYFLDRVKSILTNGSKPVEEDIMSHMSYEEQRDVVAWAHQGQAKLTSVLNGVITLLGRNNDVDEVELAKNLAPLLSSTALSTQDLQDIAKAVNDELARRQAS